MSADRITLLPCPFCGSPPEEGGRPITIFDEVIHLHFIQCFCGSRDAASAYKFGRGDTAREAERKATIKWNTRSGVT